MVIFKNPYCEVRSNIDVSLTGEIFEVLIETLSIGVVEVPDLIIEYCTTAIKEALVN